MRPNKEQENSELECNDDTILMLTEDLDEDSVA